jgi:transposase
MGRGRPVTDAQINELRRLRATGASLKRAAMLAGMDRKTARKHAKESPVAPPDPHAPNGPRDRRRGRRTYRTRPDPLVGVWPQLEEMLQREPRLTAKTLLDWLEREHAGQPWTARRRSLERRVRQWKAQHGPAKEIFFEQRHEPGRLGSSDFTRMNSLGVTIGGQRFDHLLHHYVLTWSNWEHVTICFSESFASLSEGLQRAWTLLGGVPARHRTDRLTMAVNASGSAEEFTTRYQALLCHYGVTGEATNAASAHENGDCEQSHRRLKEAIDQALLLRGSRDFASRADYEEFLIRTVTSRNLSRSARVTEELRRLRPLPAGRLETTQRLRVRVHRGSTIRVLKNAYSVPSRLIGEWVEAIVGLEEIEVLYAGETVQRMPRLRGSGKHRIDWRHMADWLARKPGAFARYVYREEMFPSVTYRRAYEALCRARPERADTEYVRILRLASGQGEEATAQALESLLARDGWADEASVRAALGLGLTNTAPRPVMPMTEPATNLAQYDELLSEDLLSEDVRVDESDANESDESSEAQSRSAPSRKIEESIGVSNESAKEAEHGSEPYEQKREHEPERYERSRHGGVANERFDVDGFAEFDESGRPGGCAGVASVGTSSADDADGARRGGSASDGGIVDLCGIPAGADRARMRPASAEADRTSAQVVEAAAGEELVDAGREAFAGEGVAATARTAERGIPGSASERPGVRPAGNGEDACPVRSLAGAGAVGAASSVRDDESARARASRRQTGPNAEVAAQASVVVGGSDPGRSRLRAAKPGRDGGAVHAPVGEIRAGQRPLDEQSAVLEVGADLQGSDDDGGGDRPVGASQRDRGAERAELPSRGGEASQGVGDVRITTPSSLRVAVVIVVVIAIAAGGTTASLRSPTLRFGSLRCAAVPPSRACTCSGEI